MREIIFRVYDKDHTCFHYYTRGNIGMYIDEWRMDSLAGYPLEQYTGLKDKNGKDIYEGDIVKFKCYGHEYTDTVEYHKWGYFPMASVDERIALSADGEVEITGNIHEDKL